eukprot:EG_transcript_31667
MQLLKDLHIPMETMWGILGSLKDTQVAGKEKVAILKAKTARCEALLAELMLLVLQIQQSQQAQATQAASAADSCSSSSSHHKGTPRQLLRAMNRIASVQPES